MVHSVELVFDPETEATIRGIWDALAAAGIPSQVPASRPHVTLAVAERIDRAVDEPLAQVTARLPLGCAISAPVLFGRDFSRENVVLARLLVPTAELLDLHAEVHRVVVPHLAPGPKPNSVPGQWTPHVTLGRRVGAAQLGRALQIANRPAQIDGRVAGLRRWDGNKRVEHRLI
jgi:2'-5' RNA ligase